MKRWMKLLMTVMVNAGAFTGIILLPLPFGDMIKNNNVYNFLALVKELIGVLVVALIFKRNTH